jgi:hypothetical protein
MLRPEKLRQYHLLSCSGTPKGSLSWPEFLSFWQACEAQHAAEAVKDASIDADKHIESDVTCPTMHSDCLYIRDDWSVLTYRQPSIGVRPLTDTEKANSVAKRRARKLRHQRPVEHPMSTSNLRHTGDWREGGVPVSTKALWDQGLSDSWRGIFDGNRSANPIQLTKIVEYYR